ncbi:MAG TPA: APC family permease [Solirubrobacteraceae bacterium]|nr:APC family permease [Solirubrobacteraceae bacterium]
MTDIEANQQTREDGHGLIRGLGLFNGVSLNMAQMVGIGPFITIPLIVVAMGGPTAVFGWIAGALIAICDGLVWAELGAAMPAEGGTYTYLREAFQYSTGRLMPFLFVWSTLLVTPLIMSTGMIGIAQYLGYFWHTSASLSHWEAVGFTIITIALLWRRIDSIGNLTRILWAGMLVTVLMVIVAAFTHFSAHRAFTFPPGAFGAHHFINGLGAGLVLAIFDYLGYYTIAYLGDETRNPGRVIPRSIVISVLGVMVIDLALNVGTMGVIPWQQVEKSTSIGSDLMNHVWGGPAATIVTILIVWTAFASVYTGLLGASRLPFNAAREGVFFRSFARLHPRLKFPHISLLAMGIVTAVACFFSLTTVINALIAMAIWVQFIGQIVALTILRRKQPGLKRPYRQWLYPLPSLIALVGWIYIFQASGWPAIRIMLGWTILGIIAYLIWARSNHLWPFGRKYIHEEFVHAPSTAAAVEEPEAAR